MAANPLGYDSWFDYVRLEEDAGDPAKIREVLLLLLLQGVRGRKGFGVPGNTACTLNQDLTSFFRVCLNGRTPGVRARNCQRAACA